MRDIFEIMDHSLKPREPFRIRDDDDELVKMEKIFIQSKFMGDPSTLGEILVNMGQILVERGDMDDAEKKLEMAYVQLMDKRPPRQLPGAAPIADRPDREKLLCNTLLLLGQVAINRNDLADAESHYKAALDVIQNIKNDDLFIRITFDLSDIQVRRRNLDVAIAMLSQGVQRAKQTSANELEAVGSLKLGLLHGFKNNIAEARKLYERAASLSEHLGNWEDVIRANLCIVELYEANDMRGETRATLDKVITQVSKHRDPVMIDILGQRLAQNDRAPLDMPTWKDFLKKFKKVCQDIGRSDIVRVIDGIMGGRF